MNPTLACSLSSSSPSGAIVPTVASIILSTVGTFTWQVPAGVTSISVVAVGGGGGGGGSNPICFCGSLESGSGIVKSSPDNYKYIYTLQNSGQTMARVLLF